MKGSGFDVRVAALALTTVFWASAFAGFRVGLEDYGPGEVALSRFLVASVVLAGYAAITRMRLPERRALPAAFLTGFLTFTLYQPRLA
jgi:drug/metabolite transporter (DMT)-like permease